MSSIKTQQRKVDQLLAKIEPAHKVGSPILFYDASMPDLDAWLESQERPILVMLPKKVAI